MALLPPPDVASVKRLLAAFALLACAACADQTATQYVGSVMSEESPEAEGSLKLTLSERTDSSFSGIMELGPPARGTGSAYAWHEGLELRIVTVGSADGDTILWKSRLTDEGVGGQYEVTGGKRLGELGTWRARLTKGPPASPATLRLPPNTVRPPVSATWPLLPMFLAAVWLAGWIRRAPRPDDEEAGDAEPVPVRPRPELAGISGWLALFAAFQTIGIVAALFRVDTIWSDYAGSMGVGAAVFAMQPLLVLELVVQLIAPVIAVGGIVLIGRHSRYAPRYWFGWFSFAAVYTLVDFVMVSYSDSEMRRLLGTAYATEVANESTTGVLVRQFLASIVWAGYWARSERVRATFGATALDRRSYVMPAAAPAVAPSGEAAATVRSSSRRRWRVALRVAGGVIVLLLVIVAITAYQTRVRPHSLPPGVDIRTTVAGKWAWTTDKKGCAQPHTIAFADGGKVMTIVQPARDISDADETTTYDIQLVTQSTIRGAIRGESRLKDDGTPVVWDLVLVGPDAYRWRRTDWSSPWGYTASIQRCPPTAVTEAARSR
jgi:hypothetical protein